eukprot:2906277-Pleurochrysis_carterae.AAC.2
MGEYARIAHEAQLSGKKLLPLALLLVRTPRPAAFSGLQLCMRPHFKSNCTTAGCHCFAITPSLFAPGQALSLEKLESDLLIASPEHRLVIEMELGAREDTVCMCMCVRKFVHVHTRVCVRAHSFFELRTLPAGVEGTREPTCKCVHACIRRCVNSSVRACLRACGRAKVCTSERAEYRVCTVSSFAAAFDVSEGGRVGQELSE